MPKNIKKLLEGNALWLAIFSTVILAVLSLISVPKLSLGLNLKSPDKYLHVLAYFGLSFIWFLALSKKLKTNISKFALILSIFIYGIILEALQGELTSYRTADWLDVIANTVGILIAALFFKSITRWLKLN